MKGWKLFLLIVLGFLAVVVIAGILLAFFVTARPAGPPSMRTPRTPVTQSPSDMVQSYLSALEAKDYQSAYQYLSRESQAKHPYDEFASLSETKGITQYDLNTAREEQDESGHMTVTVQLREDPASAGIRVVKEGQEWKVVFLGGIPSYPYP